MNTASHQRQAWLEDEIEQILTFYYPTCLDESTGGYIAQLNEETGAVYDQSSKHLVSTARFIVNFSLADQLNGPSWSQSALTHGLRFLREHHRDHDNGGYHWLVEDTQPVDAKRVCYGHAFVLLALARASESDACEVEDELRAVHRCIENRFFEPSYGLYKSKYNADWSTAASYRGQNANMHMCEAMLACYEATNETQFVDRALRIARELTVELTQATDGLIWEHYTETWDHDFEYNRDNPTHTFRPWGYQPGHQIEWAKLLAILGRYVDATWVIPRAAELFEASVTHGWDEQRGGLYYSLDRDREPLVSEKYSWEVAEAIGAAAMLYEQTGKQQYLEWYDQFWSYAERHLINQETRCWYTKVTEANEPVPRTEGVAVEPGYHPINACFEARRSFGNTNKHTHVSFGGENGE